MVSGSEGKVKFREVLLLRKEEESFGLALQQGPSVLSWSLAQEAHKNPITDRQRSPEEHKLSSPAQQKLFSFFLELNISASPPVDNRRNLRVNICALLLPKFKITIILWCSGHHHFFGRLLSFFLFAAESCLLDKQVNC